MRACIRDTKHFCTNLHRQLYDPCASDLDPSGSFSRVHIMRSHFILRLSVIVCVRITPPAGVHERRRGVEQGEKKGGISVPFPALPRLRANESQVDFSPTFLRFCAKRTVRSRARLCIDLGANVTDIFLLLDRVVRNKRKWRYIFQN